MSTKKFSQYQINDTSTFTNIITADDVTKFADLTGDNNPLHVDKTYAKKTVYKDTVVHGMLCASFVSTLIGKYIPGDGALWMSQQFDFLLPVRVNDILTISARVMEKHESQNILVLETVISNQHKQVVVKGVGKVKQLQLEEPFHETSAACDKKVVIVIGGSRGIGAATAEHLAKNGYSVAITYSKDQEGADEVCNSIRQYGGEAIALRADVCDPVAVDKMVEKVISHYGTVNGLVYGATSKIIASDFHTLEWDDIDPHFEVQVRGAFNCVKRVLREFMTNKLGSVVFLGSITADATPVLKWTGYSSAKAALHSLAKSLALEYGPQGIRFNIVSPGMTETSLIADIPEKARLLAKMQNPLRRLAKPEDIVGAIEFLLSQNAHHITGETIRINGGQLML